MLRKLCQMGPPVVLCKRRMCLYSRQISKNCGPQSGSAVSLINTHATTSALRLIKKLEMSFLEPSDYADGDGK